MDLQRLSIDINALSVKCPQLHSQSTSSRDVRATETYSASATINLSQSSSVIVPSRKKTLSIRCIFSKCPVGEKGTNLRCGCLHLVGLAHTWLRTKAVRTSHTARTALCGRRVTSFPVFPIVALRKRRMCGGAECNLSAVSSRHCGRMFRREGPVVDTVGSK